MRFQWRCIWVVSNQISVHCVFIFSKKKFISKYFRIKLRCYLLIVHLSWHSKWQLKFQELKTKNMQRYDEWYGTIFTCSIQLFKIKVIWIIWPIWCKINEMKKKCSWKLKACHSFLWVKKLKWIQKWCWKKNSLNLHEWQGFYFATVCKKRKYTHTNE